MLGRYHLFEEIEQDALGLLYLSRLEGPSGFQRWAIVRRLHPDLEDDTKLVEAFYEAARVAALVQHPNVAVVFDVGQREGSSWVAREYLHGETAADLLAQVIDTHAPVPWDLACRIVADAALGAETLHDLRPAEAPMIGFLEGVLTPSRTVVTYDGKTKLVEGCLPLIHGRPCLDAEVLAYRAPELTDEDSADVRAEVFALGVLLWELCAGKRLFGGGTEAETRARVEARAVPFLRASVRCPSVVDEVIRRALAREPEVRHPSCRVLARELEACLVSKGLNVTDDEIGRYMLGVFADRFEEREASLLSAANVTEVFDRAEIQARVAAAQAASQRRPEPPGDDDIDNTETPDATTALRPEAGPQTKRGGIGLPLPPDVSIHQLADSFEATSVVYALTGAAPETEPLQLVERKKTLVGGFDELPTVPRPDGPRKTFPSGILPRPPDSLVFIGAQRDATEEPPPDSSQDLTAETVRTPALSFDDDDPSTTIANEPPVVAPSEPRVPMLTLPAKPPSLSAVLIAHEKSGSSYWLPAMALGVVAVVGVATTLLFRHFAPEDDAGSPRSVATAGAENEASVPMGMPAPTPTPTPTPTPAPTPTPTSVPPVTSKAPEPASVPRKGSGARGTPTLSPPALGKNGLLTVFCTPACDDVLDGSRSLGPSPVFKVSVPVGGHRITLVGGDPPVRKSVNVVVNEDDTAVVRETLGN
jgi:hypothetical protein